MDSQSACVNLSSILALTNRSFRVQGQESPKKNLSDFEFFVVSTALNSASIDVVMSFVDNTFGPVDGEIIDRLLSLGIMYNAQAFVAKVAQHPTFEFPGHYLGAIIDAAAALLTYQDTVHARLLIACLVSYASHNLKVKSLCIRLTLAEGDREAAEVLFHELSDQEYLMESSLAEARLDFLCGDNRIREASELLELFRKPDFLPSALLEKMVQFYLRVGNVPSATALLKYWIRNDLCYHVQFKTLVRLVEAGVSAEVIAYQIECVDGWYRYPDLLACRAAIGLMKPPAVEDRSIDQASCKNVTNKTRLAKTNDVVLFCADAHYRKCALVAIVGLVKALSSQSDRPTIALFVPSSESGFWEAVIACMSSVLRAPDFFLLHDNIPGLEKGRSEYGTLCGRVLPAMVYGRLFAINSLLESGFKKLLYLDSDIVVLDDISPLFSIDQKGYPVSALVEPSIGLIAQAIDKLELNNRRYFNSGVMLFNIEHPATSLIVKQAIAYVLDPAVELIFHDQCALNKAVRGFFHALPDIYNTLVFPGTIFTGVDRRVILHFIDAPKPWDIGHCGGSGFTIWHDQWQRALDYLESYGFKQCESLRS